MAGTSPTNFQQGEDKIIELTFLDELNAPIDLSPATIIRAELFVLDNNVKTSQHKYTLATDTQAGYGLVRLKSGVAANNVLEVIITRDQSKTFPVGAFSISTLLQFPDTTFPSPDQLRREECNFENVGMVLSGDLRNEPLV